MVTEGCTSWERRVEGRDAGLRLDRFWARELAGEGVSREQVKDWIKSGRARVDGAACAKPNLRLEGGELLLLEGEARAAELAAEDGALDLIHRDVQLAVLDKPAGLTTHPAPGLSAGTLVHRLLHHFPEIRVLDEQRPGIVHRLDKDTSGVMAVALTSEARLALARDFAERRVSKAYLALVHGRPRRDEGRVDAPIGRHPTQKTKMAVVEKGGRPAESAWRVLWSDPEGRASLLLVRIFTGRTHQIRVHMAHVGHPLVGDAVYGSREHAAWTARGGEAAALANRQMLHAFFLALTHPGTGRRMHFQRRPPADFLALLAALDRRCLRLAVVGRTGSGKSALLRALAARGAPVFSADAEVAALYVPGGDGAGLLARRFGDEFIAADGGVDKTALLAAMRRSDGLRREIMDLVHPLVWHRLEAFWAANAGAEVAVAEIPLLQESGRADAADLLAGIWRPEEARRDDLLAGRGLDAETLALFDSWQWPGPAKLRACHLVVDNSGTLADLERRAGALLKIAGGVAARRREAAARRFEALWERLGRELAAADGEDGA
ncbi:dephospho-CoA kinase [Desulfovibrio sp.]